jgi:hypothetical protein
MKRHSIMRWGTALAASMMLFACGGPKRPDWIMKSSGAFKKGDRVLYGVGVAESIRSEALRRSTADNRARLEISQQLSTLSTSLMRDYMSAASVPADAKIGRAHV